MQSLWPKDFTQKIWVELETKNFSPFKWGTLWWFFENQKNTKGPFGKKKFLSLISLKFYVWDPDTIRISDLEFHHKKKILIFYHFLTFLTLSLQHSIERSSIFRWSPSMRHFDEIFSSNSCRENSLKISWKFHSRFT